MPALSQVDGLCGVLAFVTVESFTSVAGGMGDGNRWQRARRGNEEGDRVLWEE